MFFKKKKYHYFVSGICRNEPFMTEIILLKKVVSYDEIYRLTDELAKKYNVYFDEIIIYNYNLLSKSF
jgi:hypothetical protein